MKDSAVVYLVAGMSSRFGGKIKQFAKIGPNDETLIEYSLNQALKAGFNKIIFIVGEKTEKPFKEMFGDSHKGISIEYTNQKFNSETRDRPWGTADAIATIKDAIQEPFVICNGDDIYGENSFKILHTHLQNSDEAGTLGFVLGNVIQGTVNRGIFKTNSDYVEKIDEHLAIHEDNLEERGLTKDHLCSLNIFALHPETVHQLHESVEEFKKQNDGDRTAECYMPSELTNLISSNKLQMKIMQTPDTWLGVTHPDDEPKVKKFLENSTQ